MVNREQLRQMLSSLTDRIDKSVRFISDADRTYAEALGKAMYNPAVHAEGTPGSVARAYGSALVGTPVADSIDMRRDVVQGMQGKERFINELVQMGMPVANIGARYGMPIAGVTAAGQGLYSLGQALSGQEVQDKGTLPM
tara:strand:- start:13 stop:432 length:420 start_codon:yes stop_codon:yes gene_type:complete